MTSGNGNSASSIAGTAPQNGGTLVPAGGESQEEVCTGVPA
uniref:Polyhomeotic homolog 2 n=1 Tax=Homo sapiens TaxID=9606 RepID=A0A8I5KPD5_HUMAN